MFNTLQSGGTSSALITTTKETKTERGHSLGHSNKMIRFPPPPYRDSESAGRA